MATAINERLPMNSENLQTAKDLPSASPIYSACSVCDVHFYLRRYVIPDDTLAMAQQAVRECEELLQQVKAWKEEIEWLRKQKAERVSVKRIFVQECPKTPSTWGLVLEPIAGEAVCVIRCDVKKLNDVSRAVRTVLVSE